MRCSVCGRVLKNPISIALGIGPFCRLKLLGKSVNDKKTIDMFNQHATFEFQIINDVICITDLDFGKSVTNDIEYVLEEINKEIPTGLMKSMPIIYCDTQKIWDQVLLKDSEEVLFGGFESLGGIPSREMAIEIVLNGNIRNK